MRQTLDSADNAGQTNNEGDSDSPERGFYRKPEITVRSRIG